MAWDGRYQGCGPDAACCAGEGPATAAEAAARALELLSALSPPAPTSSPAPAPAAGAPEHTPGREAWGTAMGDALAVLQADDSARYRPAFGVASLDPEMARQEFISGGQQGLDDLLEVLGGRGAASGGGGAGSSTAAEGGAVAEGQQQGGGAPPQGLAGGAQLGAAAGAAGGAGGSPAAVAAAADEAIIKLVLARRTAWPLARAMDGVALLEALQERDPRAYQVYLSVPGALGRDLFALEAWVVWPAASPPGGLARIGPLAAVQSAEPSRSAGGWCGGHVSISVQGSCEPFLLASLNRLLPNVSTQHELLFPSSTYRTPTPQTPPFRQAAARLSRAPPSACTSAAARTSRRRPSRARDRAARRATWRRTSTWASTCSRAARTTQSSP